MILKFIRSFKKEEEPKKPYAGATITSVHIHHYPDPKRSRSYGTIEFKNGGKEQFETKTPESLIKKMNSFIAIL